jgi:Tetratricopeptide repeat
MTSCARYADADIAERYVLGQMDESEQAAFEEHFFGCDPCLAEVQVLQQMQAALKAPAPAPVAAPAPAVRTASVGGLRTQQETKTRTAEFPGAKWWGLALAASLLLGVIWWQQRRATAPEPGNTIAKQTEPAPTTPANPPSVTPNAPNGSTATPDTSKPGNPPSQTAPGQNPTQQPSAGQQPTPRTSQPAPVRPPRDLGVLALFVPPPYVPLQTRGASDTQAQAFAAAMARYNAKDYPAAVEQLRLVAEAQPDAAHVQFFLGIALLMTNQPADARAALDKAAASGTAPFADEAHFYLAKAALRDRDLDRAERELQIAIQHEAGPAGEAARLLREVRAIAR